MNSTALRPRVQSDRQFGEGIFEEPTPEDWSDVTAYREEDGKTEFDEWVAAAEAEFESEAITSLSPTLTAGVNDSIARLNRMNERVNARLRDEIRPLPRPRPFEPSTEDRSWWCQNDLEARLNEISYRPSDEELDEILGRREWTDADQIVAHGHV